MNADVHTRAQELIAAALVEGVSASDQAWLDEHLSACADCAQSAAGARRALQALRWVAVSANPAMVEATRLRVRMRARELDERQAKLFPIAVSCVLAAVVSLATLISLWRGFAWMGELWGLPQLAWQAGFVSAWFLPTVLAAAVMLWLRPPAFNGDGRTMEWSPARRGRQGGE